MRSECDIVRCSSQSLARLSNLSQSAAILYLTPVVIPAGHAKSGANTDSDPFEPFGRYLNGYHRRIRHVPYLPSVGLTGTHEEFLKEADVVIIVTCQTSSQSPDESLAQQADFASSVVEALDDHKDAAQRALPFLVQFGQDERRPDVALFDNVFRTEFYTPTTTKQMAHLLFKGHRE